MLTLQTFPNLSHECSCFLMDLMSPIQEASKKCQVWPPTVLPEWINLLGDILPEDLAWCLQKWFGWLGVRLQLCENGFRNPVQRISKISKYSFLHFQLTFICPSFFQTSRFHYAVRNLRGKLVLEWYLVNYVRTNLIKNLVSLLH